MSIKKRILFALKLLLGFSFKVKGTKNTIFLEGKNATHDEKLFLCGKILSN